MASELQEKVESRHVKFNEKIVYKNAYNSPTSSTESNLENLIEKSEEITWKSTEETEENEQAQPEKPEPKKRGRPRKSQQKTKSHNPEVQKNITVPMTRSKRKLITQYMQFSLIIKELLTPCLTASYGLNFLALG